MQGGKLRYLLTIQQKTDVRQTSGDVTFTWSTFCTAFGDVRTLSGKEQLSNGKILADMDHRVYIRSFDAVGILEEMRILWTDNSNVVRYLNIVYIHEDRTHDRRFEILCKESKN